MIVFKRLTIRNFKSIGSAELEYKAGVWHVLGENRDEFSSNGSGKTTLLLALQQCLFNKTTEPVPIEDTARKEVGSKGSTRNYKLEVEFDVDGHSYRIVNDRLTMKVTIFKDHEDMQIKSIPASMKAIQEIIGMDFATFTVTTFISHDTVIDMLDNFSSSALMKVVLNFGKIANFEKAIKQEVKYISTDVANKQEQLNNVEHSLEVMSQFKKVDTSYMKRKKLKLTEDKTANNFQIAECSDALTFAEHKLKGDISTALAVIAKHTELLTADECPTCGSDISIKGVKRTDLENEIEQAEEDKANAEFELKETQTSLGAKLKELNAEHKAIVEDLNTVEQKLMEASTKNQLYKEVKSEVDTLLAKQAKLSSEVTSLLTKQDILKTSLEVLKTGEMHKDMLTSFCALLNVAIDKYMSYVSLKSVSISASAKKSNIEFTIYDKRFNQNISVHTF